MVGKMKTWKKGVIGKLELENGSIFFTKCLKYPLLKIAGSYDIQNTDISDELMCIFVSLDILREITKLYEGKLTIKEKELGLAFDRDFILGTSVIDKIKENKEERFKEIRDIRDQGIIDLRNLNIIMIKYNDTRFE